MIRHRLIIFASLLCIFGLGAPTSLHSQHEPQKQESEKPKLPKLDKKLLQIYKNTVGAYGGLAALLRQSGKLIGFVKLYTGTDNPRQGDITVQFKRRFNVAEDMKRIDVRLPAAPRLTIAYNGQRVWGAEDDAPIVLYLRSEAAFKADLKHNYEAFLRSQQLLMPLEYVGKDKISGIPVQVVDLKHPDGTKTRYYISAKNWHILHMDYEFSVPSRSQTIKVRESFYDFRAVQNTAAPFRVVRYEDGNRVQEIRYTGIIFNAQIDDSVFNLGGGGASSGSR